MFNIFSFQQSSLKFIAAISVYHTLDTDQMDKYKFIDQTRSQIKSMPVVMINPYQIQSYLICYSTSFR